MSALKAAALALGAALVSTGSSAQDSITQLVPYNGIGIHALRLPFGVQIAAGEIELTPDQKFARAFQLCFFHNTSSADVSKETHAAETKWTFHTETTEPCTAVINSWHGMDLAESDRAFIEEVARGLK